MNHMVKRMQKYTLLDIVMMSLDHYAYCSLKSLAILIVLIVLRQCLLLLMIKNC